MRSDRGDIIGLFRQGATPMRLRAYYLRADEKNAAMKGFEFFDDDGEVAAKTSG